MSVDTDTTTTDVSLREFSPGDVIETPDGKEFAVRTSYIDSNGVERVKLYTSHNNCYVSRRRLSHLVHTNDWNHDTSP